MALTKLNITTVFCIAFLVITFSISAQEKERYLDTKSFVANVGYICEEVSGDDSCAGQQLYVVLSFTKENISIIEKAVTTCGVERISSTLHYKYELIDGSKIIVQSKPEEITYHFLNDTSLQLENGTVIGYTNLQTNTPERVEFKEIAPK